MTVCIGAICYWHPDKAAVIVASDRMVTLGGFIQYEHDLSKIWFITPKVCVMMAGDTLPATTLIQRLSSRFRTGAESVEEVVEAAKSLYETLRREQIDSEIFRPRGITMEQFYLDGLQSRLQPHLVGGIDDEVMSFDYGVELIIAGTDQTGAHLYTVGNPGISSNYQTIGYVAIGNGGIHATQSMIGFKHSGFHSLFETLFTVYASKRRSEVAPGVGNLTDLIIITPHDTVAGAALDAKQLESLDRLYNEFKLPTPAEINQKVSELNLFGTEQANEKPSSNQASSAEQSDASA